MGKDLSKKRHIAKTITWRIIATSTTFILAMIFFRDDPNAGEKATGVAIAEATLKMLLYYLHERAWFKIDFGLLSRRKKKNPKPKHIYKQDFSIDQTMRKQRLKQNPKVIWFTGLSGSGKSTLANELEHLLYKQGYTTYALDGDNVRGGINQNLSFTSEDRSENIRRIGEVSKLFLDAGVIVLCSFISPLVKDRKKVQEIVGEENFIEIYASTPIEVCEQRDVKGLYKKARAGEIGDFTGISAPYEAPVNPFFEVDTSKIPVKDAANSIFDKIKEKITINYG